MDVISSSLSLGDEGSYQDFAAWIRHWDPSFSNEDGELERKEELWVKGEIQRIPSAITMLSNLQVLSIERCEKSSNGVVLPDSLGQMTQLNTLRMTHLKLFALPKSVVNLTKLEELDLSDNCLNSLPKGFGNLPHLRELALADNYFEIFPSEINEMPALEKLDLSGNPIQELPEQLNGISKLRWLNLTGLNLKSAPISFFNLVNDLCLSVNQIKRFQSQLETVMQVRSINIHYFKIEEKSVCEQELQALHQ